MIEYSVNDAVMVNNILVNQALNKKLRAGKPALVSLRNVDEASRFLLHFFLLWNGKS